MPSVVESPSRKHARRFPGRLSRHLLAEFIVPLLGSVTAFALLSLLMAVFDRLSDFSGTGIPVWRLILFFAACMPDTLIIVSPVSALLAVCWMNVILGKNSELTAIRSAGISLLMAAARVWAITILLCILTAFLAEVVQPKATELIAWTQAHYIDKKDSSSRGKSHLAYSHPKTNRDWFFANFKINVPSEGVVVRCNDSQGNLLTILNAETAEFRPDYARDKWLFRNVEKTDFICDSPDFPGIPIAQKPVHFDELALDFTETPQDIQIQSRNIESLPVKGLLQMRRGDRKALTKRLRRLLDTMIAYRCCSPLAPLIAVLFGFAMTIATGRKGVVQGLVIAVGLYVIYYVLAQFFLVLGKNGIVNPWLAGTLPTVTGLAASLFMAWKKQ